MRLAAVAVGALALAGAALAQSGGPGDAGPSRGKVNPADTGGDDVPGSGGGWARLTDANGHMRESDYRAQLARQTAAAERFVGQPLSDHDRRKIRSAISADLIAWRKQYDPRRADYRAIHDRWLVDEESLSAADWAKRRVDWLRAQQAWIHANVGEIEKPEAIRER